MLYTAKSVANYFLSLARADHENLTPIKVQKLLYYAVGWHAAQTNGYLIDEPVEAWKFGTVVPSVLYEFVKYGAGPIKGKATEVVDASYVHEVPSPDDLAVREFLSRIWEAYGQFTDAQLSRMSLAEGGPWSQTRLTAPEMRSIDIPLSLIADYFRSREASMPLRSEAA